MINSAFLYHRFSLLCFLLLLAFQQANSQYFVRDAQTSLPIGGVNIYSSKGNFIAYTTIDGLVQFIEGATKDLEGNFPITMQHISYDSKVIGLDEYATNSPVLMTPRAVTLEEIVLPAKYPDVICLKGFFRSLKTFDLRHKYYIDGMVEFYIPTNGSKVSFQLLDYRIFCDSTVLEEYEAKMGSFFSINFLPELSRFSILSSLHDCSIKDGGTNVSEVMSNDVLIGHVIRMNDPEQLQVCVDLVPPNTVRKEKLLRLEAKTYSDVRIENYATNSTSSVGIHNLTSVSQSQTASIKRKSEFGHVPYEGLTEFFSVERSGLSFGEYKKRKQQMSSDIYKKPRRSRYSYHYWENLEHYHIPLNNTALQQQLGSVLKLVK